MAEPTKPEMVESTETKKPVVPLYLESILTSKDGSQPSVFESCKPLNLKHTLDPKLILLIILKIFNYIPKGCLGVIIATLNFINPSHLKYHLESYGYHALFCGAVCSNFAVEYGGNAIIGFVLGFAHDIAKGIVQTTEGYTFGHGQAGAHIAEFIFRGFGVNTELTEVLCNIIDQHMCTCTHSGGEHKICNETLAAMLSHYTPYQREQFAIYWRALIIGDRVGKICSNPMTVDEAISIAETSLFNIMNCKTEPKANGSIIIIFHGTPGCGKTTAAQKVYKLLVSLGYTVDFAERDRCFHMAAFKQRLIDGSITFEQYVNEIIEFEDGIKTTRYKRFHAELRDSITEIYAELIEKLCETNNIVLVDSCISVSIHALEKIIKQGDTILVWNGFPQNMLGQGISSKLDEDKQVSWPILDAKQPFYRSIIEGAPATQPVRPLVCTYSISMLMSLITVLLKTDEATDTDREKVYLHPSTYLNESLEHTLESLKENTPYLNIKVKNESSYIKLVHLSYQDGTQNTKGITQDFRGEYIILDKKTGIWYPFRLSLPVIPETGQFCKFPSHRQIYNYMKGLKPYLKGEFNNLTVPYFSKYTRCFALPKPDGSLGVITCIKKGSPIWYYMLKQMQTVEDKYIIICGDFIIAIGTKNCISVSQAPIVEDSFNKCIIASYGSIENFTRKIISFLKNYEWNHTASVIFEMVPEHAYQGLTVDYGRTFAIHLSTILWQDETKKYLLPDDVSRQYFEGIIVREIACTEEAITAYYLEMRELALAGKIDDLEGLVFAFTNGEPFSSNINNHILLLLIKAKYPWYYAAHKPNTNVWAAQEICDNPLYDNIRHRLPNLSASQAHKAALADPIVIFKPAANLIRYAIIAFNTINMPRNKGDFMKMFKADSTPFKSLVILGALEDAASILHIKIEAEPAINCIIPSIWDKVLQNPDPITTIEYISVWLLNKYGNDRLKAIVKANSSK